MKLSALHALAISALAADGAAAAALAVAEDEKIRTAGEVETSREAFAHGLAVLGGSAVDTKANPPQVYRADSAGTGYTVETVPDIEVDADIVQTGPPPEAPV